MFLKGDHSQPTSGHTEACRQRLEKKILEGSEEEKKKIKAAAERQDEFVAKQVEETTERWRERKADAEQDQPATRARTDAEGQSASSNRGGPSILVQPAPAAAVRLPQSEVGLQVIHPDPFGHPLLAQGGIQHSEKRKRERRGVGVQRHHEDPDRSAHPAPAADTQGAPSPVTPNRAYEVDLQGKNLDHVPPMWR